MVYWLGGAGRNVAAMRFPSDITCWIHVSSFSGKEVPTTAPHAPAKLLLLIDFSLCLTGVLENEVAVLLEISTSGVRDLTRSDTSATYSYTALPSGYR